MGEGTLRGTSSRRGETKLLDAAKQQLQKTLINRSNNQGFKVLWTLLRVQPRALLKKIGKGRLGFFGDNRVQIPDDNFL